MRRRVLLSAVATSLIALAVVSSAAVAATACGTHPWCNASLSAGRRATLTLRAMGLSEKLALVADGSAGDPRLGIPRLRGIDGPNGIGESNTHVTTFPDAETLAAAWDPALAHAYGRALGAEAAGKGYSVLYAPTVNIVRTPKWGREAETLGEDPFLAGSLDAPEIRGIQSEHVISQVKHFVVYNQELDRFGDPLAGPAVSVAISRRALEEIYLPPFRAAVGAGRAASVMCAYNRMNSVYSCQDPATLGLLASFGFSGYIGPDAELAVRDVTTAANAGVDNFQLGSLQAVAGGQSGLQLLTTAVDQGTVTPERLDAMTHAILTAMFEVGAVDHPARGGASSSVSTPVHRRLATTVAEDATVLLRNRGAVLPLSPRTGSIAVVGHDAGVSTQAEEGGSPTVDGGPVISPLAGIRATADRGVKISYAPGTLGVVPLPPVPTGVLSPASGATGHGLDASYYASATFGGSPHPSQVVPTPDFDSAPAPLTPIPGSSGAQAARFAGSLTPPKTGVYRFSLTISGQASLYVGGRLVVHGNAEFASSANPGAMINDRGAPTISFQGSVRLTRGQPVPIRIDYSTGSSIAGARLQVGWEPPDRSMLDAAVSAARRARVAVVFANDVTAEGMDRTSLRLPGDQDRLIEAVARVNPRTIVVLHTAGPVLMPWLAHVAAVLQAWYPGQQSGAAIAATLFGASDPSGHLPVTFPRTESQGPATTPAQYPGVDDVAHYDEGLLVGYRYYDAHHQRPLFPFGFGLSYTSFSLGGLTVKRARSGGETAFVRVRNTGTRAGAEVVQAYVGFPRSAGEPPRQLKAYARVALAAGSSRTLKLQLPAASFEKYDPGAGRWSVTSGRYRVFVGTSSADLPLQTSVSVR